MSDVSQMSTDDLLSLLGSNGGEQDSTPQGMANTFAARAAQSGNPLDIWAALQASQEAQQPTFMPKTDRINMGITAPLYGLAQLGANIFGPIMGDPTAGATVNNQIATRELMYQGKRQAAGDTGFDKYRTLGEIMSNLPLSMMMPGANTTPTSLGGAMGQGAMMGGMSGVTSPVTDTQSGYGIPKLIQTGIGAATGAVGAGATYGLGGVAAPNMSADVSLLQSKGVQPTLGQLGGDFSAGLEDKLTSIPGPGDIVKSGQGRAIRQFNTAALNEALAPVGDQLGTNDAQIGRDGLKAVADKLSDRYNQLLPLVGIHVDGQFNQDLQNAAGEIAFAAPAIKAHYQDILQNQILPRIDPQTGTMSGDAFKALESQLTKQIDRLQPKGGDEAALGDAFDGVLGAFRSNLERNNPQYAQELAATNRGWAIHSALRKAVANTNNPDGVFTPVQLWSALRQSDTSAGKSYTAYGTGGDLQNLTASAMRVLGGKYPDSGTAGRAMAAGAVGAAPSVAMGLMAHPALALPMAAPAAAMGAYTPAGQSLVNQLLSNRTGQIFPLVRQILQHGALPAAGIASPMALTP